MGFEAKYETGKLREKFPRSPLPDIHLVLDVQMHHES